MAEIALTRCWIHGQLFECDAEHVCTVHVNRAGNVVDGDAPGARQVCICDPCIELVNARRAETGMPRLETAAEHAARLS